jgi:heme/copper-type cytochrome/quinol oxidase subunit 2
MAASENGKQETVRTLVKLGVEKEAKTKVRNLMMMMMMMMMVVVVVVVVMMTISVVTNMLI